MTNKPYIESPKQRWVKYYCPTCDLHFKLDLHDRFDSKLKKNVHCPCCLSTAEKR